MSVEIRLVGGPAGGRLLVIDGDPMNPPPTTEVLVQEPLNWRDLDDGRIPEIRKALYRREANPSDDGPLWLYRYDRLESANPARQGQETP